MIKKNTDVAWLDTDGLPVNDLVTIGFSIVQSKWCVDCYPKNIPALFTYKGNSLCENHLMEYKQHD